MTSYSYPNLILTLASSNSDVGKIFDSKTNGPLLLDWSESQHN